MMDRQISAHFPQIYTSLKSKSSIGLALAFAVREYKKQEGKWPDSLEELVPAYIPEIEKDEWETPYKFDIDNNIIVITSAGPDKKFDTYDDEETRLPKILKGKSKIRIRGIKGQVHTETTYELLPLKK